MAGAIETKKQENGSRIVFESVIEKGKFPTTSFIEKVYPDVPAKWVDTYRLQSEALKKYLGNYIKSKKTILGVGPMSLNCIDAVNEISNKYSCYAYSFYICYSFIKLVIRACLIWRNNFIN